MQARSILLFALLLASALAGCVTPVDRTEGPDDSTLPETDTQSPYAGLEARSIKALSAEQIDDLRKGKGMGLALAAELNNHPGPLHALELADDLGLTQETREKLTLVRADMLRKAVGLGERIIDAEGELEAAFAAGNITETRLEILVARVATLQGELRIVHLATHIETRAMLTANQVAHYDELRGYNTGAQGGHTGSAHNESHDMKH